MPLENHSRRTPSIRDIAERAGVSITTVSHALSGKRHVAPETIERIRALVPELGYVPYAAARNLQAGRMLMIGLVVPDVANQFFSQVAQGVEEAAHERRYGVVLSTSHADVDRERRYFNLLRSRAIDGLIYIAGAANWDDAFTPIADQYPIVIADEPIPSLEHLPFVGSDHRQGGSLAGAHLRELGHQRAAIILGPEGLTSTHDRLAGFREHYPDALIFPGDFTEHAGHTAGKRLTAEADDITAVFASNDLTAFGVINALTAAGRRVPEDISVIGFDDIDFASRITPSLTTVRQPANEIGRKAATLLIDSLLKETRPTHPTVLSTVLASRGTTQNSKRKPVRSEARNTSAHS